ncbi:hypothetical protein GETHLI_07580 [Geothrix limicola]|uniref:D-glucuronyl C5-epimerase C-terminal domain-containing protein n=1 Tax=Geothrix limicola TaxID=2927978 RepID=A0ABQ5QCR9_9BACT|nr:hypothetical protein [Geothrix limicola]GLH72256.1 hypothetical protein GETHLI_07580 [Geothrix limicola]
MRCFKNSITHHASSVMRTVVAFVVIAGSLGILRAGSNPSDAKAELELTSSDADLVKGFAWAKKQALAYVFEGDPVGPWYEAALPGRMAFCMRDTAHQANGAQALGLARHTKNMLHRFAENISESRDWCSYWEIDRLNRAAPADYKDDKDFWYNLPANFDVLDCCYRMYLWTGDAAYLNDPAFLNFYDRTVNEYVQRWDLGLDRIMQRRRAMNQTPAKDSTLKFRGARGIPGYDEGDSPYCASLDLLGTQYAAYQAYAQIQDLRGSHDRARQFRKKATGVRALVNTTWWNPQGGYFHATALGPGSFEGRGGLDPLYYGIVNEGPQAKGAVDELVAAIRKDPSSESVEGQSHQAEVLYRCGLPDLASQQLLDLTQERRSRQEYPEVSFSVVGAIVTGLMGIEVVPTSPFSVLRREAPAPVAVRTLPALGKLGWVELRHLPVRDNQIGLRHEAGRSSTFHNERGPDLTWEAAFEGRHQVLRVNGKAQKARLERGPLGRTMSVVRLQVRAGGTATVALLKAPSPTGR